jgi:hypothetical protein
LNFSSSRIHFFHGKKEQAVVEPGADKVFRPFAKPRGSFLFEDLIELGIFIDLPRREPGFPLREFLEEFVLCVSRLCIAQETPPPSKSARVRSPFFAII